MSFMEHLSELRLRLRNAAIVFLVAVIGSFFLVKQYFVFLTGPAREAWKAALPNVEPKFVFISPTEPFWVYTKLAMYGALLVASPFVFWELWKFVAPGLYKKERRMAILATLSTAVCFMGGAFFGFKVLLTPALTYLLSFAELIPADIPFAIEPTIRMDDVVGFTLGMLLGTGIAFELPVILAVLGWMGIITSRQLWRFNRYALILCALAGGILTPSPDVLSQLLMSGPLFALYNVSIVIVWMIERANRKRLAELEKETGADLTSSGSD
jgi:sec-independent protein translocase protein TatC